MRHTDPPSLTDHLHYREFDPSPALTAFVMSYWEFTATPTYPPDEVHVIWPDGCVSLSVVRRGGWTGARVLGPSAVAPRVPLQPGDHGWGIRFWPDAGGQALGTPARRLRGYAGSADAVIGARSAADLVAALAPCRTPPDAPTALDDWLRRHLAGAAPIDDVARRAVTALIASDGRAPMDQLAAAMRLSLRQVQRRFGDAVGLSPKEFARIRRLRAALSRLLESPRETWGTIAAELGYADQAHLVRDVVKLTGLTPTAIAERLHCIAHTNVRP